MKLFIIDDDEIFVMLTKKIVQSTGISTEISEFNDGEDALMYIKQILPESNLLPDMILLDLNMPIMDGWKFLEEYVQLIPLMAKKVTLFIFSSSISPHDIERAKGIPLVCDFIIKPLTRDKFVQMASKLEAE